MSSRNERIMNEFNKLKNSKGIPIVKCEFIDGNISKWKVAFKGPSCSAYEDGIFEIRVELHDDYPEKRPWLYFITKMFHPNVQQSDGKISITLLYNWISTMTIEDVLYGFLEVMVDPKVGPGYGEEPNKLLAEDRDKFFEKVEEYTMKYAMNGI